MRSLRARVIRGILIWSSVAVLLSLVLLITFFQNYSLRLFDEHLASHHRQVVIALADTGGDPDLVSSFLNFPEYQNAFSGSYWQLTKIGGDFISSPSATFGEIELPEILGTDLVTWDGEGPDGLVRGMHQKVSLEDGSQWIVSVAQSMSLLESEREEAQTGFMRAIFITAAIAVSGVAIQMLITLRPLTQMREEVAERWHAGEALKPEAYPSEVSPLVKDINTLLSRNRSVVDSARRQAADLAHALKTPTAVIRNVLERPDHNTDDIAEAKDALDRIDAQILRSLARIRAGNAAAMAYKTEVLASCNRLARLFQTMNDNKELVLDIDVPAGLTVMMDQQDLEEVLGNLIENAHKWRQSKIHVSAKAMDETIAIFVDDDGPGVPEDQRTEVLQPGRRLDMSAPGTGLGLAIANDLVTAYDGKLRLETAPTLGGLRVVILLPQKGSLLVGGEKTAANEKAPNH